MQGVGGRKNFLVRDERSILVIKTTGGGIVMVNLQEVGDNARLVNVFQEQDQVPVERLLGGVGAEEQRE